MSRNRKRSTAVKSPESAALVSQEAGLPAEGGGPVSRPAWAPGDVDLIRVPEPVRRAVAKIVEPAYRKLVAEVEDPLERSIGLTLVQKTSGQLTVTRWRGKGRSWALGVGSWGRAGAKAGGAERSAAVRDPRSRLRALLR